MLPLRGNIAACRRQRQKQPQLQQQPQPQEQQRVAISFIAAQVIGRSAGRSSVAAAAYRAGVTLTDERTGEVHDFARKEGVREAFILAPANAPAWMKDRAQLWNGVERSEKRKDSQLARELVVALPHELPHETRRALVVDWVQAEFVGRGMVADVAMHKPGKEGDSRNEHAHVMLSMRSIEGDKFGKKVTEWNDCALLEEWKDSWAERVNSALEKHQIAARIDARSYEQQAVAAGHDVSLANLSSLHLGPAAARLERRGVRTVPGDLNREIRVINLELERARREAKAAARVEQPQQAEPASLQRELQQLLRLDALPTADAAAAAIKRRREELSNDRADRIRRDQELQFRDTQARIAADQVREIEKQRADLQARGVALKSKLRKQQRQARAIEKWTGAHPLRARLLAWANPTAAARLQPPAPAALQATRAAFERARHEHHDLQARYRNAQEALQRAAEQLRREGVRAEQAAAQAHTQELAELGRAYALAERLQQQQQAARPTLQPEPVPSTPRPVPTVRRPGPAPGMS